MDLNSITSSKILAVTIAGIIFGLLISLVIYSASGQNNKPQKVETNNFNNQELNTQLETANQLLESGKIDDAISKYKLILAKKPDSIGVINNLAVAYMRQDEIDKARKTLEQAVSIKSKKSFENLLTLYAHLANLAYSKVQTGIDIRTNGNNSNKKIVQESQSVNLALSDSIDDNHQILLASIAQNNAIKNNNIESKTNKEISDEVVLVNKHTSEKVKPILENSIPHAKVTNADKKEVKLTIKPINQSDKISSNFENTQNKELDSKIIEDITKTIKKSDEQETALANPQPQDENNLDTSKTIKKDQKLEIILSLNNWAHAWENKDLEEYFSSYSSNFIPQNRDLAEWKKFRESRILPKKNIEIRLSKISIDLINNQEAIVSFNQSYRSDNISLRSRKNIQMELVDNSWKIVKEGIRK